MQVFLPCPDFRGTNQYSRRWGLLVSSAFRQPGIVTPWKLPNVRCSQPSKTHPCHCLDILLSSPVVMTYNSYDSSCFICKTTVTMSNATVIGHEATTKIMYEDRIWLALKLLFVDKICLNRIYEAINVQWRKSTRTLMQNTGIAVNTLGSAAWHEKHAARSRVWVRELEACFVHLC